MGRIDRASVGRSHGETDACRIRRFAISAFTATALAALAAAPAGAAVNGTDDPNALAAAITGAPTSGATLDAAPQATTGFYPDGIVDAPLGGFPTSAATFAILTSGNASLADQPNDSDSAGESLGYSNPARGEAFDPTTLGVSVNVPANANCLAFDYKFLSEEFPEFVNAGFNDAFIAELDSSSWRIDSSTIVAPGDFAAPTGDKVSVDNVGPTAVSAAEATGTTYDAATPTLTTKAEVSPGGHVLYLSVFDSGDSIYDSAVFVDNLRFSNEPPIECKPPDLFGGATGVDLGTTAKVKGKSALIPVACGLDLGITVNCEGQIGLSGKLPPARASAAKAKAKTLGKGSYSVPPGQTQAVPVKLTRKARKAISEAGKLKAKAKVTNSSNGATSSSRIKLKAARRN